MITRNKAKNFIYFFPWLIISHGCRPHAYKDRTEPLAIEISDMKFNPGSVRVSKGTRIAFMNHDLITHNIVEKDSASEKSFKLRSGETYTITAEYNTEYYCTEHLDMNEKIFVGTKKNHTYLSNYDHSNYR